MGLSINLVPNPGSAALADAGTVEPEDSQSIAPNIHPLSKSYDGALKISYALVVS